MKKWLTSFCLLFALAGGVFVGMPAHSEKMEMMKCCDKAKSKNKSAEVSLARLCCALNCSDSAPTSASFSGNFSPSSIAVEDSISAQIADLYKIEKTQSSGSQSYELGVAKRSFQPKYIQHHSFLI
ncbi:MAG: hypothetical protein WBO10_03935 [Pyrinomonadaceae bacterium]